MSAFTVPGSLDGQRLDRALAERLEVSRSRAADMITAGRVGVDGRPAAKSTRLRAGQEVTVAPAEPAPTTPPPPLPPVRYRDEHLLVLAKPAGLVVHPGPGWPDGTLVDALRAAGVPLAATGDDDHRPGIVHRLDRDTSGLLVVACDEPARRGLVGALRRHDVERRYRALVEGELPGVRGRLEGPIGRDPDDRERVAVVADGKPAVTHWRVRAVAPSPADDTATVSELTCELETGRTHQIRVHLSEAGHPVVGDRRYGAGRPLAAALGLGRPFLHAEELALDHPVTGRRIELTEPLPADLSDALDALGDGAGPAGPTAGG